MATVDLDNSERSLMQALIRKSLMGQRNDSTRFRLNAINAKLVAPVAPDPDLREAIAKAAFDSQRKARGEEYGAVDWDQISGRHREGWLEIADAVLAVLAERGVR